MQMSFFSESDRLEKLTKMGDGLDNLNKVVDWRIFTRALNEINKRFKYEKGGRPPFDNLLMFKVLLLKRLFCLTLDQTEFLIYDRLSFMRFLGLSIDDQVPDAKIIGE